MEQETVKSEVHGLLKYTNHLPTCSINQNWDEALMALSDTPNNLRDEGYYSAIEEINTKRNTCTCGLEKLKAASSASQQQEQGDVGETQDELFNEFLYDYETFKKDTEDKTLEQFIASSKFTITRKKQ